MYVCVRVQGWLEWGSSHRSLTPITHESKRTLTRRRGRCCARAGWASGPRGGRWPICMINDSCYVVIYVYGWMEEHYAFVVSLFRTWGRVCIYIAPTTHTTHPIPAPAPLQIHPPRLRWARGAAVGERAQAGPLPPPRMRALADGNGRKGQG